MWNNIFTNIISGHKKLDIFCFHYSDYIEPSNRNRSEGIFKNEFSKVSESANSTDSENKNREDLETSGIKSKLYPYLYTTSNEGTTLQTYRGNTASSIILMYVSELEITQVAD